MIKKKLTLDKKTIINFFNEKKFNKISKHSKYLIESYAMDIDICKLIVASEISLQNYLRAEQYIKKIITNNQNDEMYYLYGNVLKVQNKFTEAINAYKNAISLNKNFSQAYNNLANTQKKINENENAINNYIKAIKTNQKNLEAYFNLANLYRSEKKYEEAVQNYQKVLELNPNFVDAINNIGAIELILGNFKSGLKYFKKTIEIDKFNSEAYINYVSAQKIVPEDEIFLKLQKFVEIEKLSETQNMKMYYALSKSYFDIDNNKSAFEYLQLANEMKLEEMEYSFKKQSKNFKKIKEYFSQNLKVSLDSYNFKSTPIFILGMPRSGTSLIEQIISNHSDVFGGGELDILPSTIENSGWEKNNNIINTVKKIRNEYLSKLSKISDKKFITDKLPGNFKWIGFIISSIPEAKILHIKRNPMAICWSNYKSNFNNTGMGFTHKQEYIAEYYSYYKDLMNFWEIKYPNKFINISYEELVESYEINIKKIFDKLGLNWQNKILDFHNNKRPVETASFLQVRKKIYKNSSDQWKKYKDYLNPMMKVLIKNKIDF